MEAPRCDVLKLVERADCHKFRDSETLSFYLQEKYGPSIFYPMLAEAYGACVVKNIRIDVRKKEDGCEILGSTPLPQDCEDRTKLHLIELSMFIYSSSKEKEEGEFEWALGGRGKEEEKSGHASNLLINHELKTAMYFEPNGVTWWTDLCEGPLFSWIQSNYPDYKFITPEETCPLIGPQALEQKGTCWLWALLQFVTAISCPEIPTDQLIERIIYQGPEYLSHLILKFGCWLADVAQKKHLDLLVDFYFWFQREALPVLFSTENEDLVYVFNAQLEQLFSRGDVPGLVKLMNEGTPLVGQIWILMPRSLQADLRKSYEPYRIIPYRELVVREREEARKRAEMKQKEEEEIRRLRMEAQAKAREQRRELELKREEKVRVEQAQEKKRVEARSRSNMSEIAKIREEARARYLREKEREKRAI